MLYKINFRKILYFNIMFSHIKIIKIFKLGVNDRFSASIVKLQWNLYNEDYGTIENKGCYMFLATSGVKKKEEINPTARDGYASDITR